MGRLSRLSRATRAMLVVQAKLDVLIVTTHKMVLPRVATTQDQCCPRLSVICLRPNILMTKSRAYCGALGRKVVPRSKFTSCFCVGEDRITVEQPRRIPFGCLGPCSVCLVCVRMGTPDRNQ